MVGGVNSESVCPRCGKRFRLPNVDEGGSHTSLTSLSQTSLCPQCFAETMSLEHPSVVHIEVCPRCGISITHGKYFESSEDMIDTIVPATVLTPPQLEVSEVEWKVKEHSSSLFHVMGEVYGAVGEIEVHLPFSFDIKVSYRACVRCSRLAGGYYEAVVQFRSFGEPLTDKELDEIEAITNETLRSMSEDRMSFISRREKVKGGIDLYVGSKRAGRRIADNVLSRMGGSLKVSSTLIGRKDGKELYRMTYAVRLPSVRIGDVVRVGENYFKVSSVGRELTLCELYTGASKSVPHNTSIMRLGDISNAIPATVLSSDESAIEVLHPTRHVPVWINKPIGEMVVPGDEVRVLLVYDNGGEVLLPL